MSTQPMPTDCFRKRLPTGSATAEEFGWLQVAGRLQVPALLGRTQVDSDTDVITYEDVFASGRCQLLLGDLIALADDDLATTGQVASLIDAVCDDLIAQAAQTGRTVPLSGCVPTLYADRIRPGGRVDTWYLHRGLTVTDTYTGDPIPVRTLTGYTATVNGTALSLDLPATIQLARAALHPDRQWASAITQGDPTEPNIATSADGACWLDFEHAGRNTLPGDIANLLWYLLALGGWLVPTYQSDVYTRTLPLHRPPAAAPAVEHAELSARHRRLDLHYTWPSGSGRRTALTQVLARLATDLGDAAGLPSGRQLEALRPFLALRILGVIPPSLLTTADLLLVLAKLAEAQHLHDHDQFTRTALQPAFTTTLERP
ncbi:hypothetical protein ACFWVU_27780 [Streptomyces sp. NPDC058686]|uniref:hypothetical protein n=1 Tax=Streptomyces sp. NPDC058686 TaxID=3346599 RepID=UPI0036690699